MASEPMLFVMAFIWCILYTIDRQDMFIAITSEMHVIMGASLSKYM